LAHELFNKVNDIIIIIIIIIIRLVQMFKFNHCLSMEKISNQYLYKFL
jgi:hypothetical protein